MEQKEKDLREELERFFVSETEYTKVHKLFLINEVINILNKLSIQIK
jgi:hypothetical protein